MLDFCRLERLGKTSCDLRKFFNKENDNKFVPIKTKNTFEGVSRDEIFISKDRIPYQPVKYQFSDSFIWENKTDGSVIELNIPSQRFFYVPIKTD